MISLAKAKNRTIRRLVPRALNDGIISDVEFNLILNEMDQYYEIKVSVTSGKPDSDKPWGKTTAAGADENKNAKANNKENEIRKQINEEIRGKCQKSPALS